MGNVFEEYIYQLRTNPGPGGPEAANKVADDLEAMDKVMVAITGEGDENPPTVHWHNTALELLMDAITEMEMAAALDVMSTLGTGDLKTTARSMGEVRRRSMMLMFMIGHELGEGEYTIEKHMTCEDNT